MNIQNERNSPGEELVPIVPTEPEIQLSFYDRTGTPISLRRYVELHRDLNHRILLRDQVGEREVITAWLGVDQSLGDNPAPLIFGTVARQSSGQFWRDRELLAATESEALSNHERLIGDLTGRGSTR